LASPASPGNGARLRRAASKAITEKNKAEALAYAADINLAQQALRADNYSLARELLDQHRPHHKTESRKQKAEMDLRGWEWRYLWEQSKSEGFKLFQQPGPVQSLSCSPDGRWLAIGTMLEGGLTVLDISNRHAPHVVTNIVSGSSVFVAFSPKEPLLAFSINEGAHASVRLWDPKTHQTLHTLAVNGRMARCAFSQDGLTLVTCPFDLSGKYDGQFTRWRVADGVELTSCTVSIPSAEGQNVVAFSPDGTLVGIGGDTQQVVDLTTGKRCWSATNEYGTCGSLVFSADGRILVTAQGADRALLSIYDVASGQPLGSHVTEHRAVIECLVLWPDGKTLASSSMDRTIRFWDVSDPAHPRPRDRAAQGQLEGGVMSLALLPDHKTLLGGSGDGSIWVWDTTSLKAVPRPMMIANVQDWRFASDGKSLLALDGRGQVTRRSGTHFNLQTPLLDAGPNLDFDRAPTDFSANGRWLTITTNGVTRVWDLEAHESAPKIRTTGRLLGHGFATSPPRLVVYEDAQALVQEWDLSTAKKLRSWPLLEPLTQVTALSPDDRWFLSVGFRGAATLRELATGRTNSWASEVVNPTDANFSADGKRFAIASYRGYARVWETTSLRLVARVGDLQSPIYCLNFTPDGRRLVATSSGQSAATLWDLVTGRELMTIPGRGSQFIQPMFSADDLWLCYGSDQSLFLCRAPSRAEIEATEKARADR
jgi:WD40 repeat protein